MWSVWLVFCDCDVHSVHIRIRGWWKLPDGREWLLGKLGLILMEGAMLTGKHRDAGVDWRQEEKGTTEDEMVGWHHQLDGHEFEQALGVGDGQGSLECCSPWGHKESDTTERLIWTELCPGVCLRIRLLGHMVVLFKEHPYCSPELVHLIWCDKNGTLPLWPPKPIITI